jgi:hypothetical protein
MRVKAAKLLRRQHRRQERGARSHPPWRERRSSVAQRDLSHRRTTHEFRARQHLVIVRNVGGVTKSGRSPGGRRGRSTWVPVGPAAQAEP